MNLLNLIFISRKDIYFCGLTFIHRVLRLFSCIFFLRGAAFLIRHSIFGILFMIIQKDMYWKGSSGIWYFYLHVVCCTLSIMNKNIFVWTFNKSYVHVFEKFIQTKQSYRYLSKMYYMIQYTNRFCYHSTSR